MGLFVLHRLRNKFSELILSRSRCLLPGWTSTRAHCVTCKRHEVQSRSRRDSNLRPSDSRLDTLPLDHLSSSKSICLWCKGYVKNIFFPCLILQINVSIIRLRFEYALLSFNKWLFQTHFETRCVIDIDYGLKIMG